MKICIVTPEYPPDQWGGLARTVERVAVHLRDMELEVHIAHFSIVDAPVVLLDENRLDERMEDIKVHRIRVGREDISNRMPTIWDSPFTRTFKMMFQSLEMLHAEERFACLHSFFLFPTGYVTGILARKSATPSVLTIVGNDIYKYPFSPDKSAMCRSGLENADRVVALSQDLLDTADGLYPVKGKGHVVYNAVEIPESAWVRADRERFHIGCAGIFKYAKGLPYLIKAVAQLRKQYPVTLELLGEIRDTESKAFHYMVEKSGIGDVLVRRPAVPHQEVSAWFLGLDVFVLPSVSEGCPNILMEAMAAGLPCVATDVGAVTVLMQDGISGFVLPKGRADVLAAAIERILLLPDRGQSLGASARKRMRAFSRARERMAWQGIYRDLIHPLADCHQQW
ncbi:glycosyltransferase [Desulfatirhabdium butyrativorans]|uniref:glycosyltransferase n=1 Tax=Desulfatirhabdium butyrativorans TaxID=340467 RepID=UPI00146FA73E|nr:glycosyltransferase [Desulfatirhabdium butyrativorans]